MFLLWTSLVLVGWTTAGPIPWTEQPYSNETNALDHHYCVLDGNVYRAGESFTSSTPCNQCVCRPPNVECEHIPCEKKMGCRAIQLSDQCCPQYQCECETNGRVYNNGEKLEKTDSPCKVCYCRGGVIVCGLIQCYTRDDCKPQQVPGRCCPKYDHCPPIDNRINSLRTTASSSPTASETPVERQDLPVTHGIFETSASNRYELLGEVPHELRTSSPGPFTVLEDDDDQDPSESNPLASLTPRHPSTTADTQGTATPSTPLQDPSLVQGYPADSDASASEDAPLFEHKTTVEETTTNTPGTDTPDSYSTVTHRETDKDTKELVTTHISSAEEQEENGQSLSVTTDLILKKDNENENASAASEKRTHIQSIPPRVKEDALISTNNSKVHEPDTSQLPDITGNTEDYVSTTKESESSTQEATTGRYYDKVTFIPFETNTNASPHDVVTERMHVESETQTPDRATGEENTSVGTTPDDSHTDQHNSVQKDDAVMPVTNSDVSLDVNQHVLHDASTSEKDFKSMSTTTELETTSLPTSLQDVGVPVEVATVPEGGEDQDHQSEDAQQPLETTTRVGQSNTEASGRETTQASTLSSPQHELASSHEDVGSSGEDSWEHHRPTQMVTDEIHYITTAPPVKDEDHIHPSLDVADEKQSREEVPPQSFNNTELLSNRYDKLGESESSHPRETETTQFTLNDSQSPQEVTEGTDKVGSNDNTVSTTESTVSSKDESENKKTTRYVKLGEERLDDITTEEIPTSTARPDELSVLTDGMDDEQNDEGKYKTINRSDDEGTFDITNIGITDSEIPYSYQSDQPTHLDEPTVGEVFTESNDDILEDELQNKTEVPFIESSTAHEENSPGETFTTRNINATPVEANTEQLESKGNDKEYFSSETPGLSLIEPTIINEQDFDSPPVIKLSEEMANHQMVVEIHHITPVLESAETLGAEEAIIHDASKEVDEKHNNERGETKKRPIPSNEDSEVVFTTTTTVLSDDISKDTKRDDGLKEEVQTRIGQDNATLLLEPEVTKETLAPNIQQETQKEGALEETVSDTQPTTLKYEIDTTDASTFHNEIPGITEGMDVTTVETPTTIGTQKEEAVTVTESEHTKNAVVEKRTEDALSADSEAEVENREENTTVVDSSGTPDAREDVETTVSYDSLQNSSENTSDREISVTEETTSGEEIRETSSEIISNPDEDSLLSQQKSSFKFDSEKNIPTIVTEETTVGAEESSSQGDVSLQPSDTLNNTSLRTLEEATSVAEKTTEMSTNPGDVSATPEELSNSSHDAVETSTPEEGTTEVEFTETATSSEDIKPTATETSTFNTASAPSKEAANDPMKTSSPELITSADEVTNANTTEISSSPVDVTTAFEELPSEETTASRNTTDTFNVTTSPELGRQDPLLATVQHSEDETSLYTANSGDRQEVTPHISTIDTSTETTVSKISTEHKETTYFTDEHLSHHFINDLSSSTFLDETTSTPESTGSYSPAQESTITDNSLTSVLPKDFADDLDSVLQFQANKTKDTNATQAAPADASDVEEHLTFQSNRTTVAAGDHSMIDHDPATTEAPGAKEDVFTRLQREDIEELGKYDLELLQNFFKNLYVKDDLASES